MMNCSWALCSLMTSKHPEPWICGGFRCLHRSVEMLKQSKEQNVGLFPFFSSEHIHTVDACCTIIWTWNEAEYEPQNLTEYFTILVRLILRPSLQ